MHGTLLTSQCMETSGDYMSTSFISKAPGSLLPSLNPGLTLYYFTRGMVNWKKAVSQWKGTVIYQTKNILFTVFLANDHLDIWLRLLSGLERKWEAKTPASGFIVLSIFLRQTMLWRSWESWEQSPRQGHPVAAPNKAPVCICSAWGVSRGLQLSVQPEVMAFFFHLLSETELDHSPCAVRVWPLANGLLVYLL